MTRRGKAPGAGAKQVRPKSKIVLEVDLEAIQRFIEDGVGEAAIASGCIKAGELGAAMSSAAKAVADLARAVCLLDELEVTV
jgi:hypothetical protein